MDYLCQGGDCSPEGTPDCCIFSFILAEGDPAEYLPNCQELCVLASRLSTMVLVSATPEINPDILKWLFEFLEVSASAKAFFDFVHKILIEGIVSQPVDKLAVRLTQRQERLCLLFQSVPGHTVWMCGAGNLRPIVGPAADRVRAVPVVSEMLPPAGQAAFKQLMTLVSEQEGGNLKSSVGILAIP